MCEFCEKGEHIKASTEHYKADTSLSWSDGAWRIVTKVSEEVGWTSTKINSSIVVEFCPMCGRRLSEKEQL